MSRKHTVINNIVSIMTNCAICNKVITKKNYEDGIYLCDVCKELDDMEKAMQLYELMKQSNEFDYDDEELDDIITELYERFKIDGKRED